MNDIISNVTALEACVGKVPGPRDLKVIDYLDEHAVRWIAASPLLFCVVGDSAAHTLHATAAGGDAGFTHAPDARHLRIPLSALDDAHSLKVGQSFGSLFLVPGLGETLRVNGRVQSLHDDTLTVAVEECYLHCAKALMRSDFWQASPVADIPANPEEFLARVCLMVLGTTDAQGHADVSPKGDPAGQLLQLRSGDVWYPDRPGNRRVDSFRNILDQPAIALLAVIPGCHHLLLVKGHAQIRTDSDVRDTFTVQGKVPKVVTRVAPEWLQLRESPALIRAKLWPAGNPPANLNPADIFKDHVKLNKTGGLQARLLRAAISVPGLMKKGLENDYKNNLY